ncbi:phosphatidate cytidylyltransferase [Sphingomonas sp. ASV193]|uniref:phosphatidate cytidylyltransferase n=1 Tax=Sphingomonas sp. ASV193 TaxID=3144405 RepID=UPI0032E8514D
MSELAKRSVLGVLMIAAALIAAVLGGYVFASLVALAAVAMLFEWRRMVARWGIGWQVAGFVYALVPALSLLWIRDRYAIDGAPMGLELLVWVFVVTWSTDIGAYFAGRTIGGPKLAPSVSPNKTWAGLVGGVVIATLLAAVWARTVMLPANAYWLAAPFAVAAQLGDLFESGLKRRAGVKDSGNLLPGHGGALDRLDGLVVVASLTAAATLAGLL